MFQTIAQLRMISHSTLRLRLNLTMLSPMLITPADIITNQVTQSKLNLIKQKPLRKERKKILFKESLKSNTGPKKWTHPKYISRNRRKQAKWLLWLNLFHY